MSDPSSLASRPRHSDRRRSERSTARRSRGKKYLRRRRILIGIGAVVALFVVGIGAAFGYAWWRYGQIPKVNLTGLTPRPANGPFNILLVGSDSRAFAGDTGQNAASYGSSSSVGGQRSDVIIIARVDPATHSVRLLSIPRDTWVQIPGNTQYISGQNRINAAFNSGPQLLLQTIVNNFRIPISDYVEINFEGLTNIVNSVSGVYLDFHDPVYDIDSHLGISKTGCHLVFGSQALALVRSRHLYYKTDGIWHYDGLSDWSRIQRQDAFFRALLPRMKGVMTDPLALNSLLSALPKDITIDSTLSKGALFSLANTFRGISGADLVTQTLPTAPYTIDGQAVVVPAPTQDTAVINDFLAYGTTPATTTSYTLPKASARGTADALLTRAQLIAPKHTSVAPDPGVPVPSAAQVVTNTQQETWNPTPCQPGS